LESQLRISSDQRWASTSIKFQHALFELKIHHIQRLQLLVERYVTEVAAHTTAIERRNSNTSNRHDMTDLSRARANKKRLLKASLQELQYWHSVYHDPMMPMPEEMRYAALGLSVEVLCDAPLPWSSKEWFIPSRVKYEQQYLRAQEEMSILKREARDAVEYHEHHLKQCAHVIGALNERIQVAKEVGPAFQAQAESLFLPGAVHLTYVPQAKSCLMQRFLRGEMALVIQKKRWFTERLAEIQAVRLSFEEIGGGSGVGAGVVCSAAATEATAALGGACS
jgi:hypothetical protein